jgi:putative hydrolase of the HAD superfamily
MDRHRIEHIFFDLDHTVWDFETNSDKAYRRLLEEFETGISFEDFAKVYHPVNYRIWEDYARGKYTKEQVKILRLQLTLEQMGYDYPQEKIGRMAERYLDLLAEGTVLFPGAVETLEYLAGKYPLHLITNGFSEVQYRKIEKSGLKDFFRTVTLSEETGKLKPHPSVFKRAMEKAGAVPHLSMMVGDSFQSDITGALNVGMQAVLFDPENRYDIPEAVVRKIRCLTELKKMF